MCMKRSIARTFDARPSLDVFSMDDLFGFVVMMDLRSF